MQRVGVDPVRLRRHVVYCAGKTKIFFSVNQLIFFLCLSGEGLNICIFFCSEPIFLCLIGRYLHFFSLLSSFFVLDGGSFVYIYFFF